MEDPGEGVDMKITSTPKDGVYPPVQKITIMWAGEWKGKWILVGLSWWRYILVPVRVWGILGDYDPRQ